MVAKKVLDFEKNFVHNFTTNRADSIPVKTN
jgi:hypothetical protein